MLDSLEEGANQVCESTLPKAETTYLPLGISTDILLGDNQDVGNSITTFRVHVFDDSPPTSGIPIADSEEPGGRRAAARALAEEEEQRFWQIWVRVILGGERRIDLAREYGFSDGSGITQTLKRLQNRAASESAVRKRMNDLHHRREPKVSSVKS